MDAQEAVLRAQIPHVHEWEPLRLSHGETCDCGAVRRAHPFGVVIPDDSKDQT